MSRNRATAAIAAICVLGVLAAVALGATSGGSGDPGLAAIKRDTAALRAGLASRDHGLKEITRGVTALEGDLADLGVSARVDVQACAGGAVQCADDGTGHTFAPAGPTNHNPVAIAVLVTRNGGPRLNLVSSAFDFSNSFVPAGGPGLIRCPEGGTGCAPPGFQDGGDGTYLLWVHPAPAGANWKAGAYFARIVVSDPTGRQGSALVKIVV
jgi:hypothetical protein